jgi:hypothetical protein
MDMRCLFIYLWQHWGLNSGLTLARWALKSLYQPRGIHFKGLNLHISTGTPLKISTTVNEG